jgi:hypothetical protein
VWSGTQRLSTLRDRIVAFFGNSTHEHQCSGNAHRDLKHSCSFSSYSDGHKNKRVILINAKCSVPLKNSSLSPAF